MLKQLLVLWICVLSVVRLTHAAEAILPSQPKPAEFAHQKGCYVPDYHMVLPYNKPHSPKDCSCKQYTCHTNGETQIFTCGAVAAGDGCTLVEGDLSLAYPHCCKTIKCS